MANGKIEKARRIKLLERLIADGKSSSQIASALGVSTRTVKRYVAMRRDALLSEITAQTAVLRQQLISSALSRIQRVDAIISDADNVKVALMAEDIATRIERNLARLVGAELPARHEHLHVHANASRRPGYAPGQVIQTPTVNISFEPFEGGDPDFVPGHRTSKPIDVEAESLDATSDSH